MTRNADTGVCEEIPCDGVETRNPDTKVCETVACEHPAW
jgi:hypothetical protein